MEPESVASSLADVGFCCGGDVDAEVGVSFLASCCFWAFTSASDCIKYETKGNMNCV